MAIIAQHVKALTELKEAGLDLKLTSRLSTDQISTLYMQLQELKPEPRIYQHHRSRALQVEMGRQPQMLPYILGLVKKHCGDEILELEKQYVTRRRSGYYGAPKQELVLKKDVQDLLEFINNINKIIKETDDNRGIFDYPDEAVLFLHKFKKLQERNYKIINGSICFNFLEFFRFWDKEETDNMWYIFRHIEELTPTGAVLDFESFTRAELGIFSETFYDVVEGGGLTELRVIANLTEHCERLKLLLEELEHEGVTRVLPSKIIPAVSEDDKVLDALTDIVQRLNHEDCVNYFSFWEISAYSFDELINFDNKSRALDECQLSEVLQNQLSYVNFLHENIPAAILGMVDSYPHTEDIILYAIANHKKAFLKLTEENREAFLGINEDSILFYPSFFSGQININTLNPQNMKDLNKMTQCGGLLHRLKQTYTYTFNEIKSLLYLDVPEGEEDGKVEAYKQKFDTYIDFYHLLDQESIDRKLLSFRQIKNGLHLDRLSQTEVPILARHLSHKSLNDWINCDFSHIQGITPYLAVTLILIWDKMKDYIAQACNTTEAVYIIQNADNEAFRQYKDFKQIMRNIISVDVNWNKLMELLAVPDSFVTENMDNIQDFCLKNGPYIAMKYYENSSLNPEQKADFLKIIKSQLLGRFNELKYHGNDLSKELMIPVSEAIKDCWRENITVINKDIHIMEQDDFFSTINVGELPRQTCLSYNGGSYCDCLLSSFDSNKKILYAYLDGQIVGRAFIRFTKGSLNPEKAANHKKNIPKFIDISVEDQDEDIAPEITEDLIVFLERPYFSYINKTMENKIMQQFIKTTEEKARNMGVIPVLSNDYSLSHVNDRFKAARYHVFISLSKAGNQYLDSLNGSNSRSSEGKYHRGNFYIQVLKEDENE